MNTIKVFASNTNEYARIYAAAALLNALDDTDTTYTINDIYFDYGANWMWTTIVAHRKDGTSWQALYPVDQEKILTGSIEEAVKDVLKHSYSLRH